MAKAKPESELPRTVEAFDRWHLFQPERWEFINGVPVMMAPPSLPHTIIKGNIYTALRAKLAGTPCRALVDGAEIKSRNLSAIPDVLVACGPLDQSTPTVEEPSLIVEVNSPSSERDDTHRKWQGYCLLPSLKHYLVVAQEQPFVTLHTRTGPSSFEERVYEDGTIELSGLGVSLSLAEIYDGVEFPASADDHA
jgi:Uma2 family endonuclease